MYTLYYSPASCALPIHALCYHLELDCEMKRISIDAGENRTADYRAKHPLGQLPLLVHQERTIRESLAIILYLVEHHPSPLWPEDEDVRLNALQWLSFCNSTLHQSYSAYFLLNGTLTDHETRLSARAAVAKRIDQLWRYVTDHLEQSPYLAGDSLTIADMVMAVILHWTSRIEEPVLVSNACLRVAKEVATLDYMQQALAEEQIQFYYMVD